MYSKKELLDYCVKFSSMEYDVHAGEEYLLQVFKIMHYAVNALLSELGLPKLKTGWHPEGPDWKPEDGEELDFYFDHYNSVYWGSLDSIPFDCICEAIESLGGEVCHMDYLNSFCSDDWEEGVEPDEIKEARKTFQEIFSAWFPDEYIEYFDSIMSGDQCYNAGIAIFHLDTIDHVLNRKLTGKEKSQYEKIRDSLECNLSWERNLSGYDALQTPVKDGKHYIVYHPYTSESWWADELGIGLGFVFAIIGLVILDQILGGAK